MKANGNLHKIGHSSRVGASSIEKNPFSSESQTLLILSIEVAKLHSKSRATFDLRRQTGKRTDRQKDKQK